MKETPQTAGPFLLPSLPYPYDALEPVIDEKTLKIHHTELHQGYVDKLNTAIEGCFSFHGTVDQLLRRIDNVPESIREEVRNNAGGHHNHSLFWETLSPQPQTESPTTEALLSAVRSTFGSLATFQEHFNEEATNFFSNGWTWLCSDRHGELLIRSTKDHDTPLHEGLCPLLVVDIWEHAYCLKYQNRRAEYLNAIWKIMDWSMAAKRWESVPEIALQTEHLWRPTG